MNQNYYYGRTFWALDAELDGICKNCLFQYLNQQIQYHSCNHDLGEALFLGDRIIFSKRPAIIIKDMEVSFKK